MYLENFKGLNSGAMLDEFKFAIKHRDKFERIAIIGDSEWLNWVTKGDDIFSRLTRSISTTMTRKRLGNGLKKVSDCDKKRIFNRRVNLSV